MDEEYVLSIRFTDFEIDDHDECDYDDLTITDGVDGTTLMEKTCGYSLPDDVVSTSNIVNLVFSSDQTDRNPGFNAPDGWSVSWSAVTPGKCQQLVSWI